MAYYTLLTRDDPMQDWSIQFGDYDRECVEEERKDSYSSCKKGNWKIIKTKTARQSEINSCISKLNHEAKR